MKKLLVAILLSLALSTQADTTSVTVSGGSTNSLLSVGNVVNQIIIGNAGSASATVRFIDAPSTGLTYTLSAYTNTTRYLTNLVTTFTNLQLGGVIQTNTNQVLFSAITVTAASTNNYTSVGVIEAPAGTTFTLTPTSPWFFSSGVLSTNGDASGNLSITLDYSPFQ